MHSKIFICPPIYNSGTLFWQAGLYLFPVLPVLKPGARIHGLSPTPQTFTVLETIAANL